MRARPDLALGIGRGPLVILVLLAAISGPRIDQPAALISMGARSLTSAFAFAFAEAEHAIQQNAALSEESSAASTELLHPASDLSNQVAHFVWDETSQTAPAPAARAIIAKAA